MIPKHKCTPYCEPDDGIHCLPNRWVAGKTPDDFSPHYEDRGLEVVKVKEELDVTDEVMIKANREPTGGMSRYYMRIEKNDTGYLVWVREKDPA